MPIYEYKCYACGHMFEALQKISESPLMRCPDCGKDALKKLISASAFRLKGGGWYETDFKTGDKKNVAQTDKPGKAAAAGKADKKGKPDKPGRRGSTSKPKKSGSSD